MQIKILIPIRGGEFYADPGDVVSVDDSFGEALINATAGELIIEEEIKADEEPQTSSDETLNLKKKKR